MELSLIILTYPKLNHLIITIDIQTRFPAGFQKSDPEALLELNKKKEVLNLKVAQFNL